MTRIFLIRHALTDSVGKTLSGRMPSIPLNEQGQLQAKELAERVKHLQLSAIYSSPIQRAVETANALSTRIGIPVVQHAGLEEIDFGDWTGSDFEALAAVPSFQLFNTFRSHAAITGGETMLQAQVRIVSALQEFCRLHRSESIAVVSHSDLIKAAIAYYAGVHLDMFQRIEISPASISVLEIYDDTARILHVNHCGDLKV